MARPRGRRGEQPSGRSTPQPRATDSILSERGSRARGTAPQDPGEALQQSEVADEDWFALPEGEPMGIEDIRDALVIRERSTFMLTDPTGNVTPGNRQGFGIYHGDTRHLSTYHFSLN